MECVRQDDPERLARLASDLPKDELRLALSHQEVSVIGA